MAPGKPVTRRPKTDEVEGWVFFFREGVWAEVTSSENVLYLT